MTIRRRPGRERFLVVANAVFIKERLVHQISLINTQRYRPPARRRCRGEWDPLIFPTGGGIGVARIDDDHSRVRALAGLLQIPVMPPPLIRVSAGLLPNITTSLLFSISECVAVVTAVGVGHGAGNLRSTVGTVLVKRAAVAVH